MLVLLICRTGNKVVRVDRSTFEIIDIFIPQAIPGASDGGAIVSQLIWLNNTLYVGGSSKVVAYSATGQILGEAGTINEISVKSNLARHGMPPDY